MSEKLKLEFYKEDELKYPGMTLYHSMPGYPYIIDLSIYLEKCVFCGKHVDQVYDDKEDEEKDLCDHKFTLEPVDFTLQCYYVIDIIERVCGGIDNLNVKWDTSWEDMTIRLFFNNLGDATAFRMAWEN